MASSPPSKQPAQCHAIALPSKLPSSVPERCCSNRSSDVHITRTRFVPSLEVRCRDDAMHVEVVDMQGVPVHGLRQCTLTISGKWEQTPQPLKSLRPDAPTYPTSHTHLSYPWRASNHQPNSIPYGGPRAAPTRWRCRSPALWSRAKSAHTSHHDTGSIEALK